MTPQIIFPMNLVLGYVAWLLCFGTYIWPKLKEMNSVSAQRVIATLHSFRFIGLVFLVPGVVGPHLPAYFARSAAYLDFATSLLAIMALLLIRVRPLFWLFVTAFNLVGAIDLLLDYHHAISSGLRTTPGELGAAFVIPVLLVPMLMITHVAAFYLMFRSRSSAARS
jgi:nicotinamide riboside transporter PnuC